MPYSDGTMVRGSGPEVFRIDSGSRRWLTSAQLVLDAGGWDLVQNITDQELSDYPIGPAVGSPEGSMFIGTGPEIFIVSGGQRRWLTHPNQVEQHGGWGRVIKISEECLRSIIIGPPFQPPPDGSLFIGSGPRVYWIEHGLRRWVPNPQILDTLGGWPAVSKISDEALNSIPEGQSLPDPTPSPSSPSEANKEEYVGNKKKVSTHVVLYRNGSLMTTIWSKSGHWSEGLRARCYLVLVDDQNRQQWTSKEYICTTRGSVPDLFTPSEGTDIWQESVPDPVARLTNRIDIFHSSGPLGPPLTGVINFIRGTQEIYEEIKPFLDALSGGEMHPTTPG